MRLSIILLLIIPACSEISNIGGPPDFSSDGIGHQLSAIHSSENGSAYSPRNNLEASSLWSASQSSLLGDRRANSRGDILTAVIEIDDRAELVNTTNRSRSGKSDSVMPSIISSASASEKFLPNGVSMDNAFNLQNSSKFNGTGKISRQERMTLRIAATVIEVLPNGSLHIEGSQELRLNNELRQLTISGYVRAADITRQNEIQYDKVAAAKFSYGGKGAVTDFQKPKLSQYILDSVLPF